MQVSTKFTISLHILVAVEFFSESNKITSDFLSGSIGANPVIIRNLLGDLKKVGILEVKRGTGGITLKRPLSEISFLDIYRSVETTGVENLFHFHEKPNQKCPVGRNIKKSLDDDLKEIQQKFEEELSKHKVADIYEKTLSEIKSEN